MKIQFQICRLVSITLWLGLSWLAPLRSEGATDLWTGTGADNHWSTPANWSGGVSPSAGDNLTFAWISALSSGSSLPYNDAYPGSSFGQITVGGNSSSTAKSYTFSGNLIGLTGGLSVSAGLGIPATATAIFNLDITLGADQTFITTRAVTFSNNFNLGEHTLTLENSSSVAFLGTLMNTGVHSYYGILNKTNAGTLTISSNVQLSSDSDLVFNVEQGSLVMDAVDTNQIGYFEVYGGSLLLNGTIFSTTMYSTNAIITGTGTAQGMYVGNGGNLFQEAIMRREF